MTPPPSPEEDSNSRRQQQQPVDAKLLPMIVNPPSPEEDSNRRRRQQQQQPELEALLAKKENNIKELTSNLSELKEDNAGKLNEIHLLNQRLIAEAGRMKLLERKTDCLRSEKASLESKLERMELRANDAEKESRQLTEQLEELRKKLNEESEVCEKLKSSHENIELLKKELVEERGRREGADSELLRLSELRGRVASLQKEVDDSRREVRVAEAVLAEEQAKNQRPPQQPGPMTWGELALVFIIFFIEGGLG